jgi:hypothetical protein
METTGNGVAEVQGALVAVIAIDRVGPGLALVPDTDVPDGTHVLVAAGKAVKGIPLAAAIRRATVGSARIPVIADQRRGPDTLAVEAKSWSLARSITPTGLTAGREMDASGQGAAAVFSAGVGVIALGGHPGAEASLTGVGRGACVLVVATGTVRQRSCRHGGLEGLAAVAGTRDGLLVGIAYATEQAVTGCDDEQAVTLPVAAVVGAAATVIATIRGPAVTDAFRRNRLPDGAGIAVVTGGARHRRDVKLGNRRVLPQVTQVSNGQVGMVRIQGRVGRKEILDGADRATATGSQRKHEAQNQGREDVAHGRLLEHVAGKNGVTEAR